MKAVFDVIRGHQRTFASHPFLKRLDEDGPFDRLVDAAPALTFWALGFQDVLRINEARVSDSSLKEIVSHHRYEDAGHQDWFLHDLRLLGRLRDLEWAFGPEHADTRDATYAILSEVFRASSDHVRIALLFVLEATGSVFFTRVASYVERTHYQGDLKYFARHHLEVEEAHELWEHQVEEWLQRIELSEDERDEILAMVERVFRAFHQILDHLSTTEVVRRHARGTRRMVQLERS